VNKPAPLPAAVGIGQDHEKQLLRTTRKEQLAGVRQKHWLCQNGVTNINEK
jgi:hypothetical protein